MKPIQTLLCVAVAGAMAFAASKAPAFPLFLKSVNVTLTVTPSYSAISSTNTTSAKYTKVRGNLKNLMTIVTNQVRLNTGTTPDVGSVIAYDPYLSTTYLTNTSTGYYHNLSGIVYFTIEHIATKFKLKNNGGGSENDVVDTYLDIYGDGPDGLYYEAYAQYAPGTLKFSGNGSKPAKMTITGTGGGYGAFQSSNDGVSQTKFKFQGSGDPEWSGPFSLYWWYNLL